MGKLCPKGKAAAKRKFDVYPSAYANMYASAVLSGKIKPGGKKKVKKNNKKKIYRAGTVGGLRKWVSEKWVDIGAPKKDGKFQPCGRKNAKKSKRKYPKCVPLAKAQRMTAGQKTSAVKRKRAKAQGIGGKPTFVKSFIKKYA